MIMPTNVELWVTALLSAAPDADRDKVAVEILGFTAAQLVLMTGGRAAAAALYALADKAAAPTIPDSGAWHA